MSTCSWGAFHGLSQHVWRRRRCPPTIPAPGGGGASHEADDPYRCHISTRQQLVNLVRHLQLGATQRTINHQAFRLPHCLRPLKGSQTARSCRTRYPLRHRVSLHIRRHGRGILSFLLSCNPLDATREQLQARRGKSRRPAGGRGSRGRASMSASFQVPDRIASGSSINPGLARLFSKTSASAQAREHFRQ